MTHRMTLLVMVLLISSLSFTGIVNAGNNKKMKRMKIRGTVERVEGREAVILTPKGQQVRVMIGPESYWAYRGYHLAPGQNVSVYGWYPDDRNDRFYAGSIAGSGFSYRLTDRSGMPMWVVQEEHRTVPSYVVYQEWYGPQYIYSPPRGHMEVKKVPPGHRAKAHRDNRRH